MATLPWSEYVWLMQDLWKSNSYLWVEGACQLTWKIWFVGLRAAKNVDGGIWRLVITPWSMQRSAWRATSTWLGHPQWPLDNSNTLGHTLWSWGTERGRRETYYNKDISQKCGHLNARSTSVQPINYWKPQRVNSKQVFSPLLNTFNNSFHHFLFLAWANVYVSSV